MTTRYITVVTRNTREALERYLYPHTKIVREKTQGECSYFILETTAEDADYSAMYQCDRLNSGWGFAAKVHETGEDVAAWLFDEWDVEIEPKSVAQQVADLWISNNGWIPGVDVKVLSEILGINLPTSQNLHAQRHPFGLVLDCPDCPGV